MKGLIIAGTMSGCGKTTIALGFMACLKKRGFDVAPFKVGPDFIDPGHHTRITGKASRNLDGWMLSRSYNMASFARHAKTADMAVVEGVMGLFDGYDGKNEDGSTAQMAKWIGLPVLLIVDARSMARSAAALVQGFERFDANIIFAGVLFNNIGSDRHLTYLKEAMQGHVNMPCLGGIHRDAAIAIPERHLGLVTQEDHFWSKQAIDKLADIIENSMDVQKFLESLPHHEMPEQEPGGRKQIEIPKVRIGLPMDNAFCFYYADNLDILASYGAEIVCFSPLNDSDLPENLDGLYLGGGYPELFAEQLSENTHMRQQIRENSMEGMPIYGECGGFMYLCSEIRTTKGKHYPMVGCFPFVTTMFDRLKSLGYRDITLTKDTIIGKRGQSIRGHEFHYSEITEFSDTTKTTYQVSPRKGLNRTDEGFMVNNTLGSYTHLHFGSFPDAAGSFVASCLKYGQKKGKTS